MDNIIEALKKNEKPFGLMSEEMQHVMVCDFKKIDFEYYAGPDWDEKAKDGSTHNGFMHNRTYRLRDTYEEPEAGVEKCEVRYNDGADLFYFGGRNSLNMCPLSSAINLPDFIGYLYEDGYIRAETRVYRICKASGAVHRVYEKNLDKYEVLTPTHILFRKQ